MLKELILSILSFAVISPASFLSNANIHHIDPEPIVEKSSDPEDPDVLHGYTYEDVIGQYGKTYRVFDSREIGPQIKKVFCAPRGYAFTITVTDEQINELFDQAEFKNIDYDYVNISYYYGIYGAEVYKDSENRWYTGDGTDAEARAWYISELKPALQGHLLLEVDNVTNAFDIYLRVEMTFAMKPQSEEEEAEWFNLVTLSETVHAEPFKDTDFVNYRLRYYQGTDGENRLNIDAVIVDGFFNQLTEYNQYGWLTDTTVPAYALDPRPGGEDHYRCVYNLALIAYDSIPFGAFDAADGLELSSFPKEPVEVKIKLSFTSGGTNYVFYSDKFIIGDPNVRVEIDAPENRQSVQKYSTHIYSLEYDNFPLDAISHINARADLVIERLMDDGQRVKYLYDGVFPTEGEEGVYYYVPSADEVELHNQGRDEELIDIPSQGTYYIYNDGYQTVSEYPLLSANGPTYTDEEMADPNFVGRNLTPEEIRSILNQEISIPVIGKFSAYHILFDLVGFGGFEGFGAYIHSEKYYEAPLEVVAPSETEDVILLNTSDNINLLAGAGDIRIIPSISSYDESVIYYYDFAVNKDGVIDVIKDENNRFTIAPLHAGLVELTIGVECSEFSRITKTVTIRVLDTIYDVAKLELPNEFHYADQDITISVNIRGFKDIQNISIDWKVFNKAGEELPAEKMEVHDNASMTLLKPESGDYTVVASYEGIELDQITFEVRQINLNKFLRANIWWIVLITLGFVAALVFLNKITTRGRSTVDSIQRVYDVFTGCMTDDRLSLEELKRIKRSINHCVNRVEDLNVEALNQYEKPLRYLRKSNQDAKALLNKWENITPEEKSVYTERLDADLSKALSVAKEIQNAKQLVDEYHDKANRQNYEVLKEDKKK